MLNNVKNKVSSNVTKVSAKELKNTVHTPTNNKLVFDYSKNKGLNATLRKRACFIAGTKITSTENHSFWVIGKGWVAAGRNTYLKGFQAKNFASASKEVDIKGYIPKDAISLYYDPSNLK